MHMTSNATVPSTGRAGLGAALALITGAVLTTMLITLVYGLTMEYGDTGQPAAETAIGAVGDWAPGIAIAAVPVLIALLLARRTPRQRMITVASCVVAGLLVAGVPAAAMLGAHEKYQRYPAAPVCTDGFSAGPAVPVTRAAQTAFERISHPAPFGGGGSSGVDGCATQLMARHDVDVRAHYQGTLPAEGWRVVTDDVEMLRAVRGRQTFELTQDGSTWWVWIGPSDSSGAGLGEGVVGPHAGG
ncbi:MAG: hypothetical protein AVDCRST_MAG34-2992 [uncultured Nocardioidaceae bacterium]|uniref:Uncharacterized protein n=1 Tax=uncultured Nocardioidaceae bacterium TaxID=253824 RepID=A0A6J4MWL9_9ACTN|nr:MAG: hypothetical protein AVDCRST_MAG34-2992 [uncultured Nocardioidaceae bacterium]